MKIQLISDLHMEFSLCEIQNAGADVLVLSGDIVVADYFNRGPESPYALLAARWISWFEHTCAQFDRVYYVLGNHEHYKGCFYETYNVLWQTLKHIDNLIILDAAMTHMDTATDYYGDFTIVGGTLWTDFDRSPAKASYVQDGMNDYRLIEGRNHRKLKPAETVVSHDTMLSRIRFACETSDRVIVLGHHGPSYRSVAIKYEGDPLNAGYYSHLDEFIRERPQIKLWTHGHTHSSHDYDIGSTRIVCNPRGYDKTGYNPENTNFNPNLILEV